MSVTEIGDLVNTLRATSERVAEAHARLERDAAARKAALTKQAETALQRSQGEQRERREEINASAQARLAHLEKRTAARKTRITRAQATSKKRSLDRIDEVEGRRKFAVQRGILDTERRRDEHVAQLESEWATAQQNSEHFRYRAGQLRESARKSFRAYPTFSGRLRASGGTDQAGGDAEALLAEAAQHLKRFRARIIPELFRFLPIWLWWIAGIALFVAGPDRIGLTNFSETEFRRIVGGALGGVTLLYFLGWWLGASVAKSFARTLSAAEVSAEHSLRSSENHFLQETEAARTDAGQRIGSLQLEWETAIHEAAEARVQNDQRVADKMQRALKRNERLYIEARAAVEEQLKNSVNSRDADDESILATAKAEWQSRMQKLDEEISIQRRDLEKEWNDAAATARQALAEVRGFSEKHFRPWNAETSYQPAEEALNAVKFGAAKVLFNSPVDAMAENGVQADAPLMLVLPDTGSVFIESDDAGRDQAIQSLNNIVYRVLQTMPPGKVAFTLIDPVRLGENFSSIMHLADFEENIVNRRIWTEPGEIEERLLELNAHMEKVIQMYLRNEFRDIVEYNKEAGRIAEKYHFLLIADFPANFTETAMRRLLKIAASGARCGVYTLIHWDKRHSFLPIGFEARDFTVNSVHLMASRQGIVAPRFAGKEVSIRLDAPPEPELATRFLQQVGEASRGSNLVQVPFTQIAPKPSERWTLETTDELRVPVGRSGATKLQYFSLGKGTRQHALIAGKTGSGKSTLFHVLVTNLALWASPEQVEFYLVDFKKGVEFKDYAVSKLPHARVVAIESDREFGLSVLRRVDEELRLRGELFRAVGAQDLAGYKRASKDGRMPRVLLLIDEFQELFVEDDSISQNAALLLDRIVRQGRAFGIHVVLGSQTLGGAYSLARATLGQMAVRIALQTNEADAYLIMDESNPAPRLLSRPGEGIYNDSGGALEANSPFQVVWLPETERREALDTIRVLAAERGERNEPIVFEGNMLADISENAELRDLLDAPVERVSEKRSIIWLGLPNEIKGPTRVLLEDRTGRNLLIAGQHGDHARALLAAAIISLAAQNKPADLQFVLLEMPSTGSYLSIASVIEKLPHEGNILRPGDMAEALRSLVEEIDRREGGQSGPKIILVVQNLSAFKALRPEDEFGISFEEGKTSPASDFQRIYTDGPVHGIHVIAHIDGFNNANRFLGRKGLKEFSARVLFQMSASDSASFADDPRAGNLGLSRALLYDEHEGTYETFRPYARPSAGWLAEVEEKLRDKPNAATEVSRQTDVANTGILPG